MNPKMLLLAGRLVVAMESMAQDVKSMATYVKDISCSVSYLLNERREKKNTFVVPCDASGNPTSATSGQFEQAVETSSSSISNLVHGQASFRDITPMITGPHENSDILSSDNNSHRTGEIKVEKLPKLEENDQPLNDVRSMHRNSRSTDVILEEMNSETPLETEEVDQANGIHTTISHTIEEMSPSDLLGTIELASAHVRQEIQRVVTSSGSSFHSDHTTFASTLPEAEASVDGNSQMESAEDTSKGHMRVRSEKRAYLCLVCEKTFNARRNLLVHTRVHTGERPFKCDTCGKAFSQRGNLSTHKFSHTGEKPHSCNICKRAFAQKSQLTFHMRKHTGEKPHSCNVCGKAFSRGCYLAIHMRCHSDERPYRCNVCGKEFKQNGHLTDHMRTHGGEDLYKCNLCGKAFRHSRSFNKHMRIHSTENRK